MKYRDENGDFQDLYLPPSGDTLPIGSEVDYDGETVPYGWEEIDNPEEYSTDEVKTNKVWINNKPIYRKVLVINSLPNNTVIDYAHNISNIDLIYIEKAFWVLSDGACGPVPQYRASNEIIGIYVNKTNVVINTNVDYSPRKGYVVLEYTKTTD